MEYILIFISAIFVNNIILSQFLGICPFLGVSKKVDTSLGMSAAVAFVMTLATIVTWLVQKFVLDPNGLQYLQTIAFILVIASLVQMVEIVLKKVSPALYQALGIFLPLITTNCAVLGVAILVIQKDFNLAQSIVYALSTAIGFGLALTVFAVLVVTHLSFRLIDTVNNSNFFRIVMFLALGSFIAVGLYQLIYLFEKIFNLVSSNRLNELADTNNKLLRELSQKAPGTFQHCLQVMSMADAAARSIDADVPLVRAGALYHDIGKMANPLCFVENENLVPVGARYHDSLTPQESAAQIIRHVTDGLEIASKNGLPDVIKEFISTHHGTSRTGYFYGMYVQSGGDPDDDAAFRYPGPNPKTKEQTVLMLCDSLEAASRTIKENTPEAFSDFVERLVDGKMKEGQFREADITIREIGIIKEVMKDYLRQIYHERIEYPK